MNDPGQDFDRRLERLLRGGPAARDGWATPQSRRLLLASHERLATLAREHFGGGLQGRLIARCGMDSTGGAFALVSNWMGAAFLGIDADAECIKRHVRTGFCDYLVTDLHEVLRILRSAVHAHEPVSVALAAAPSATLAEMVKLGVVPDLLMDPSVSNADALAALKRLGSTILDE
jgi:urocanate hydratase